MIAVRIQHHPSRADLLPPLLAAIGGEVEVITDPEPDDSHPSPWRTYRACLERPSEATHLLVLQDDVEVCRDFRVTVERAVAAKPDRLLCFFVGGHPVEHATRLYAAGDRGLPWAEISNYPWVPAVALAWSRRLIRPMLDYVAAQNWPSLFRADDEMIGHFLRSRDETPLASVPCLVEHPDRVPSLLGRRAWAGEDPARVAACYPGEDCDPTEINWHLAPLPLH